jgi:hypothetical protein
MTADRQSEMQAATPERREEAKRRAERIRQGMTSLAATIKDIATAYAERDWLVLDPPYPSWETYVEAEFGTDRVKLPAGERALVVAALRFEGMSQRAIAQSLGIAKATVQADLAGHSDGRNRPPRTTGLDGKEYASGPVETFEKLANLAPTPEPEAPKQAPKQVPDEGSDVPGDACPTCGWVVKNADGSCRSCTRIADANLKIVLRHIDDASRWLATAGSEFGGLPESHQPEARTRFEQLSEQASELARRAKL